MTTKPRNVKLKVTIKGNNGFSEESEVFKIQLGEIKQLKLITEKTATNLDNQLNCITLSKVDYEKLINLVNKTSELNNQVKTLVKKLERGRK